jgi:hypothetical protein
VAQAVYGGKSAATSGGLKIRETGFEDYEQIASLQSRFRLPIKSYEKWIQLWSLSEKKDELLG